MARDEVTTLERRTIANVSAIHPYNDGIVIGPPPSREAPLFVTREMIDYYERRPPNPALDFIEHAAAALEVSVAELLGRSATHHAC